ncbi:MAG TPA: hypothetical protein VHN39_04840 [Phenylobacterium sp.]|nr:hypothetical protein [Phenylobacterium sp.]
MLVALAMSAVLSTQGGPCRTVHGRLSLWNGAPAFRIWIVGTHRVLGVPQGDRTFAEWPAPLQTLLAAREAGGEWDTAIWGDFKVCPLTRERPGWMQQVRLVEASHLTVRPRP